MVTRTDVAKKANVSVATVSHVINNTKFVSPELRERVNEAVKHLNYKPNMVARSLVMKTTKHVGIVVSDITNPYYGEIAQGMEEVAHKHGYIVSLILASGDSDSYITSILERQMDGIFMATTRTGFTKEQYHELMNSGITVVNGAPGATTINFDYKNAISNLVRSLVGMGHKRIGYLSGISNTSPDNTRFIYLKEALEGAGLVYDMQWMVDGYYPFKSDHRTGYEAMNALLSRDMQITAVLTTNDYMAFGAMRAAREAGLKIPDDISIAGCDDIFLAECVDPPLTTLRVPKKEMGRQAMYTILNAIREKKHLNLTLEAELVIRGSTGPAKNYSRRLFISG